MEEENYLLSALLNDLIRTEPQKFEKNNADFGMNEDTKKEKYEH
jgi:hypothetical protein